MPHSWKTRAFANERFGPSPANSSKNITQENAKWPSMVADALFVGYERDGEKASRISSFQGNTKHFRTGTMNKLSLVRHFVMNGGNGSEPMTFPTGPLQ